MCRIYCLFMPCPPRCIVLWIKLLPSQISNNFISFSFTHIKICPYYISSPPLRRLLMPEPSPSAMPCHISRVRHPSPIIMLCPLQVRYSNIYLYIYLSTNKPHTRQNNFFFKFKVAINKLFYKVPAFYSGL